MCAVCDMTALIQALYVQLCQASPGGSMACHTDHAQHGAASDVEVITH